MDRTTERKELGMDFDQIVGWLEQQKGSAEYLGWINQGTPAAEALAAYEFDTGNKMVQA